jgi:hypothetical protein
MTPAEINVGMIALILVALGLVGYVVRLFLWRWFLWLIPLIALLLMGLLYSFVYLFDSADGAISNPLLFNTYNQILRGGSYIVIIAYLLAFIALQKKVAGDKHG